MGKITTMKEAAAEINRLQGVCHSQFMDLAEKDKRINHLQHKIDELMLEYCPDEMNVEQMEGYEKNQVPSKSK